MTESSSVLRQGVSPLEDTDKEGRLVSLWQGLERPLFNYLIIILANVSDAEDCLQETYICAHQHVEAGRSVAPGWLYKVARSRALDLLRSRSRRNRLVTDLSSQVPGEYGSAPGEAVRLLEKLPAADREILYLFDVDGMTGHELGVLLGIRAGAVRGRVFRARERARRLLEGLEK